MEGLVPNLCFLNTLISKQTKTTALNFFDQMPKPCKYLLQASTWALRVGEGIKGRWGQWVPQTQRRGCKRTRQSSLKVAAYSKLALLMNLLTQRTLRQAGEANGMVRQFVPQIIPGKGLLVSAQRATGGKAEREHGLLPHGEGLAPSSCCCGEKFGSAR